jgi:hypothetical protein
MFASCQIQIISPTSVRRHMHTHAITKTKSKTKHAMSAPCQIQTIFGTARSPPHNRKRKAHARSSPHDDAPC